jgi:hypothetical protein
MEMSVLEPSSVDNKMHVDPTNDPVRKTGLSSDDETQSQDPLFDPDEVEPVTPTFSQRGVRPSTDVNPLDKPWIARSLELARARADARQARRDAIRRAKENRIRAPVQVAVLKDIKEIGDRIESLTQVKNMGLSTDESSYTLKRLMQQKKERLTELSTLRRHQRSSARYRQRQKEHIATLCAIDPDVAVEFRKIHLPKNITVPTDFSCPDLLRTIEEIAHIGGLSGAYNKAIAYQRCATLNELREKIKPRGLQILRSPRFYR